MSRPGQFRAGTDPRRNVACGRPPTARGIATTIRRTVGVDAERICEQVRALAAGGDPAAVVAAALLLGSVAALARREVVDTGQPEAFSS